MVTASQNLRNELRQWIETSIEENLQHPYHGIHDEGSFTFSWDAYYLLTRQKSVYDFLTWLRDGFAAWTEENMYHGYYKKGEVHHGTEPFTHFVARLRTLDPADNTAVRLLDDVAHHTGNWAEGVPDWYDWNEHRLVSWSIGSEEVPTKPPNDYEEPDSIRPLMITLAAYATTGDGRYLGQCIDYADKWAAGLLEEPLPRVAWWHSEPEKYDKSFREQIDIGLHQRVELVVASGMADYLLDLVHLTGRSLYVRALRRIMPVLVEALTDPRSAVSAALLAKYRRITGDTQYDAAVVDAVAAALRPEGELVLLPEHDESKSRGTQGIIVNLRIGHRWDQTRWGRKSADGTVVEITEPNPAVWSLAYQITGEAEYAERAMNEAAERLRIAAKELDDGRDHGCAGNTTGAVASGHGRADRYGDVNTVFGPVTLGSMRLFSAEEPLIVLEGGLPEGVASLVTFSPQPKVVFVNSGTEPQTITFRDASAGAGASPVQVTVEAGGTTERELRGTVPLPELG